MPREDIMKGTSSSVTRSSRRQKSIHEFFPTSSSKENISADIITTDGDDDRMEFTGENVSHNMISPPTPTPVHTGSSAMHQRRRKPLVSLLRNTAAGSRPPSSFNANCKLMFDSQPCSHSSSSPSEDPPMISSQKSQSSVRLNHSFVSQDDLMLDDFLTPQDQPVVHLQNPNSPSPIKKRYRLSSGGLSSHDFQDQDPKQYAVSHLTKDMVVLGFQSSDRSSNRSSPTAGIVPEMNINPFLLSSEEEEEEDGEGDEEVAEKRKRKSVLRKRNHPANHHPPSAYFTPQLGPSPHSQQSKYLSEFVQGQMIGQGAFSQVFKVVKRLDGWTYAIKKFKRHLRGRNDLKLVLREVFALAALGPNAHVIQYYDAWIEDNLLYIQLEYCPGGSLEVVEHSSSSSSSSSENAILYSEDQLRQILGQMATALLDIHDKKIVHLDIKPSNILISGLLRGVQPSSSSSSRNRRSYHNSSCRQDPIKYKLADFGNASRYDSPSMNTVEGDNRYLSRELLEGNACDLRAGDIFALGASIYELALGRALPGQGQEWQRIRDGDLATFPQYSSALQHLIASMMHPDPLQRPRAEHILDHEAIRPPEMRW